MNSWSHEQLRGKNVNKADIIQYCKPDITNAEMEERWAVNGARLDPEAVASPCGLLAKYFPKGKDIIKIDSFNFIDSEKKEVTININGITWEALKGTKFKTANPSESWVDASDERFINWMRPNTYTSVYKAWGRLGQDLEPGIYKVNIYNGKI